MHPKVVTRYDDVVRNAKVHRVQFGMWDLGNCRIERNCGFKVSDFIFVRKNFMNCYQEVRLVTGM